MSKEKKWEIKGVKKKSGYCSAGKSVLKQRINFLISTIDLYFKNKNEESLHQVRIALRRVRYNMELFLICFDRKKFLRFYTKIQKLQDYSGLVRDLDVFKQNMNLLITDEKVKISKTVFNKVEIKKNNLEEKFEIELMKFTHSKALKDFYKFIS